MVGEEGITLSFYFANTPHALIRSMEESIHKALTRMSLTIQKKTAASRGKKVKGKSNTVRAAEYRLVWNIEENEEILDATSLTNEQWKSGMIIHIMQMYSFTVVVNPPTVASMKVFPSKVLFVGYPVLLTVDVLYADMVEYTWFREEEDGSWVQETNEKEKAFIPSMTNVGKRLKVFATPHDSVKARYGRSTVHYLSGVVTEPPISMPRTNEVRGEFHQASQQKSLTSSSLLSRVRVMSYNILADPYATSKTAINCLFPYCSSEFLQSEYRCQLILQELLTSDSDIICLQEVDENLYYLYYAPHLELRGYQGSYANKCTGVNEGCATFIRSSKFSLIQSIDIPLKEIIRNDDSLKGLFRNRSELLDFICGKLGMIAQVCVCTPVDDPKEVYLVANTHLFYHPAADFIRLLQTHAMMTLVNEIKVTLEGEGIIGLSRCFGQYENVHITNCANPDLHQIIKSTVIVCGDFNSTPETPTIAYLDGHVIKSDHEIWETVDTFKHFKEDQNQSENKNNEVEDGDLDHKNDTIGSYPPECLRHQLAMLKNVSGFPQYTNFTKGFQDCLDYIYVSLEDSAHYHTVVAPYPCHEILIENTALPSIEFPSDHLPVVVDLLRNSNGSG